MAGYLNAGVNDGQFIFESGSSFSIDKPGTYLVNCPSGTAGTLVVASGVFGVNGLANAIKVVDEAGTFGVSPVVISGAQGSALTFNGAATLTLSSAYEVYTGVIYSGSNFITE